MEVSVLFSNCCSAPAVRDATDGLHYCVLALLVQSCTFLVAIVGRSGSYKGRVLGLSLFQILPPMSGTPSGASVLVVEVPLSLSLFVLALGLALACVMCVSCYAVLVTCSLYYY